INRANFLIEKLETEDVSFIEEEEVIRILAEAKFNRALAYFNLLRYFGTFYDMENDNGVVLRSTFSVGIEADAKSSTREVYDFIIEDLEYAVEHGPSNVAHYYTGNLAAKALLAKVELYTENYESAA